MNRVIRQLRRHQVSVLLVVAVGAITGIAMLTQSGAASYVISAELEDGTTAGSAAKIAVSGASGQAVRFSQGGTNPNPNPNPNPGTWDPRQPGPNELFPASDGTPNYLRSLIPANPRLDPNSGSIVGAMGGNTPQLNGPEWQMPIYTTNNSHPNYNPSLGNQGWGCSVGGSIRIPDYATREIPQPGDEWVIVANKDDNTVKAIWIARKSGNSWSGACGGSYKLNSNGAVEGKITGVGVGSEVQAGFGFILNSEVQTGSINHALYFTSRNSCSSFRKPAGKSDGGGGGSSCVPMGARIQLDPAVDCNGLSGASRGEKMICVAMQKYGGYMLDSGGPGHISGIGVAGDDMTDPNRSPWQRPGNGMRGSRNCAPIGPNCGIYANSGMTGGTADFSRIPWNRMRVLSSWNGQ